MTTIAPDRRTIARAQWAWRYKVMRRVEYLAHVYADMPLGSARAYAIEVVASGLGGLALGDELPALACRGPRDIMIDLEEDDLYWRT